MTNSAESHPDDLAQRLSTPWVYEPEPGEARPSAQAGATATHETLDLGRQFPWQPVERLRSIGGKISESATASRGLVSFFSRESRASRARDRADTIRLRNDVLWGVGRAIAAHDGPTVPELPPEVRERAGRRSPSPYVGYNKFVVGSPESKDNPVRPNLGRPVTASEVAGARRLDRRKERADVAAGRRKWLENTYGPQVTGEARDESNTLRLNGGERKLLKKSARSYRRQSRIADRSMQRFNRVASSSDTRGKLARARMQHHEGRAQRLANPPTEENEELLDS